MYCNSCGKKVTEGLQYCEYCGAKMEQTSKQDGPIINYTKPMQNTAASKQVSVSKSKNGIIFAIGLCAIVAFLVVLLNPFSDPVSKFTKLMDQNDYVGAAALYQDKIRGNTEYEWQAVDIAQNKVEQLFNDYENDVIGVDAISDACSVMIDMGIVDDGEELMYAISLIQDAKEAYQKGSTYFEEQKYAEAIEELAKIPEDASNYGNAIEMIQQSCVALEEHVIDIAAQMTESGQYLEAIDYLEANRNIFQDDSRVTQIISGYEEDFMQYEIAKAQKLFDENKVTEAIDSLEASYDRKACELFKTAIAEYELYEPKPLHMMEIIDHDYNCNLFPDREGKDSFKNEYKGYAKLSAWVGKKNEPYILISNQGRFSKLKGTVVCVEDMHLEDSINLKIYADDKLVFESGLINPATNPITFDVDISGATTLKLLAESPSSSNLLSINPGVMIVNSLVYN